MEEQVHVYVAQPATAQDKRAEPRACGQYLFTAHGALAAPAQICMFWFAHAPPHTHHRTRTTAHAHKQARYPCCAIARTSRLGQVEIAAQSWGLLSRWLPFNRSSRRLVLQLLKHNIRTTSGDKSRTWPPTDQPCALGRYALHDTTHDTHGTRHLTHGTHEKCTFSSDTEAS
jgi:hypothetical protein